MDLHSGAAFWPLKNGLLQTYPAIDRNEDTGILIIGAGITGALVALRLAEAGADVVVVDKRNVACGSTAATTGLLLYETDTDLTGLSASFGEAAAARAWHAGREAIDAIAACASTLEGRGGFARRNSLYLASTRADARHLADEYALRTKHGFDVEWMPAAALEARYGIRRPAAILGRAGAEIDSFQFTHGLLQRVVALGARVYGRSEVTHVHAGRDGVRAATASGRRISSRHLVWATGYEGIDETQTRYGQRHSTWAFVSEPIADLGPWRDGELIWETARPYLYARVTDDGRVMVGGEDEPFAERHADPALLPEKAQRLVSRFHQLFPALTVDVAYRWGGTFTTTSDGLPCIGTRPEHPRAWLALGYGGNGITFSMIAADLIRDAWLGIDNPDAGLFSFDRPFQGDHRWPSARRA